MTFLVHSSPLTREKPASSVLNRKTLRLGKAYCKKSRPFDGLSKSSNRKLPNHRLGLVLVNRLWLPVLERLAMTSPAQSSAHPINVLPGNLIHGPEFSPWISLLWNLMLVTPSDGLLVHPCVTMTGTHTFVTANYCSPPLAYPHQSLPPLCQLSFQHLASLSLQLCRMPLPNARCERVS